ELLQTVLPNVDVRLFVEAKCKRRNSVMIERARSHLEHRIIEEQAAIGADWRHRLAFEAPSAAKLSPLQPSVIPELMCSDDKVHRVALDEIPRVRRQLVSDLLDEAGRSI